MMQKYTYDNDSIITSVVYNSIDIKNSYYENGILKTVTNKNGNEIVS